MADFIKDPSAVLDFNLNWSDWLTGAEEIVASTWTSPDGLTIDTSSYTSSLAVVWLSGGTNGRTYRVVNRITTNNSPARIEERTITVQVVER
jgi:hypothetical protein